MILNTILTVTKWLGFHILTVERWGNGGCGSVGRSVASNTRDQQFESSHRKISFTKTVFKKP